MNKNIANNTSVSRQRTVLIFQNFIFNPIFDFQLFLIIVEKII